MNWSSGQTTRNINGLTAGNYIINITDANGCLQADTFAVGEPLDLISTITPSDYNGYNISCNGGNDGALNLIIDQNTGTAPYTYSWSNGQSALNISNLTAGQYTVVITDAQGCTYTNSTNLTDPAQLIVLPTVISDYNGAHISCSGSADGELTVSVTGGVQPYDILWNNGSTNTIVVGTAGVYTVTIEDGNGCIEYASATLVDPLDLSIDLSIRDSLTYNVSCFGICEP